MAEGNNSDKLLIQRCFDLALNGAGAVAPNPMVGAVVVYDGRIIGEGYHKAFGQPHAEVNAINSVSEKERELIARSTLYVSLEPCNHHGKTPPCTDLILKSGIKKVVVSNLDPNPLVAGKGVQALKKAGCEVMTGILQEQGEWINRRFFTFHTKKRPYIILKWAQSADGFFTKDVTQQHWITGEQSKRLVHRWRSEEAAILTGTNTVLADNPQLTNRFWNNSGQPIRVVIDKNLKLPLTMNVFDGSVPTIIFTMKDGNGKKNLTCVKLDNEKTFLVDLINELYRRNILSVIVEGGAKILNSFIAEGLWDEARVFTGIEYFGDGIPAPKIAGEVVTEDQVGEDRLVVFRNGASA